jgi:hypothetical protein
MDPVTKLAFWREITAVMLLSYWTLDEAVGRLLAVLQKYGFVQTILDADLPRKTAR